MHTTVRQHNTGIIPSILSLSLLVNTLYISHNVFNVSMVTSDSVIYYCAYTIEINAISLVFNCFNCQWAHHSHLIQHCSTHSH